MDTCTVETGLLKKKPCGQASVTRCENCEQFLCSKHAIAQLKPNGLKSGKFMCKECDAARRDYEKNAPAAVVPEKKPAEAPKGAAAQQPAAGAQKAPAAPAPAKAAPAAKPAEVKHDDSAPLEFTPSKPPAEKK
jgi:hypothetical protein